MTVPMSARCPYATLGLSRSATARDVKQAFRKLGTFFSSDATCYLPLSSAQFSQRCAAGLRRTAPLSDSPALPAALPPALQHHPDVAGDRGAAAFIAVSEAHAVLSDPIAKRQHDLECGRSVNHHHHHHHHHDHTGGATPRAGPRIRGPWGAQGTERPGGFVNFDVRAWERGHGHVSARAAPTHAAGLN